MTNQDLEKIKSSGKWPVKLSDFFNRYFFLIFPIMLVIVGSSMAFAGFKNNIIDLKVTSTIILAIGLFLTLFTAKRLYQNYIFKCYPIQGVNKSKIENALRRTLNNNFKYYELGYFVVTTKASWFSWGEIITIIPDNDRILINSKPSGQPITIFNNKTKINLIIGQLSAEIQN